MNKSTIERRNNRAGKLTVRASASGTGKTLYGRIAYNSKSEDLGFFEVMAPGCFRDSLKITEVFCYHSHDTAQILGRQNNGTLTLKDTPSALQFECTLDESTTWGANVLAALKRGDLNANSYGFSVSPDGSGDEWKVQSDGSVLRTVHAADLYEVSTVSVGAYSANVAGIRSMPSAIREHLRENGIGTGINSDADGDEDSDEMIDDCTCLEDCDEQCSLCSEARDAGHSVCVRSGVNVWSWWTARPQGTPLPKGAPRDRNLLHDIVMRKISLL